MLAISRFRSAGKCGEVHEAAALAEATVSG